MTDSNSNFFRASRPRVTTRTVWIAAVLFFVVGDTVTTVFGFQSGLAGEANGTGQLVIQWFSNLSWLGVVARTLAEIDVRLATFVMHSVLNPVLLAKLALISAFAVVARCLDVVVDGSLLGVGLGVTIVGLGVTVHNVCLLVVAVLAL